MKPGVRTMLDAAPRGGDATSKTLLLTSYPSGRAVTPLRWGRLSSRPYL